MHLRANLVSMRNALNNTARQIQQAQLLAQAGNLAGAADICRAVVARESSNFYALFMLGVIESQLDRFGDAVRHLERAVKLDPCSVEALTTYGNALIEQKRHKDAVGVLDRAVALQPQNPHALLYRGLALAETGKHKDAIADFDRVLRIDPKSVFALHNRATALIALNRHKDALPDVMALLRLAPDYVSALANYALLLNGDKKYGEALAVLDHALSLAPDNLDFAYSRGLTLMGLDRNEEALAAFRKVIALKPDRTDAYHNCANALMELNRLDEALAACENALAVDRAYAPALLMQANLLQHMGFSEKAFATYDSAIAAKPHYAEAHYHRGSALLLHGRFAEGWRDFEHRWNVAECNFERPKLRAAEWREEDLSARSIAVYSEQGLGDTIQFVRFLPRLVTLGARVTFLCHPALVRMFEVFARGGVEVIASCPPERTFDFQCALMSLPERFAVRLENLPGPVPYLFAEEPLIHSWRQRIGTDGFKIGIGWQGNPNGPIDKGRSVPLEKFRPLADLPGVRLISLQKAHGLDQLTKLPVGLNVETLGRFDEGPDGFIDTAAMMDSLDLVITSDSALAHLAGALGRQVWVALKYIPDWRFMLGRSDSPWYPTMRLFRQPTRGDWESVFAGMAAALRALPQGSAS
jgi:tetratricopeptide (TPR) repeat protein